MLILISELSKLRSSSLPASKSKFKYSRNQAFKSSVNSKEHSSSEKIFQILRTRPIQLFLATGHCHQESFVAPAFLASASFNLLSWFCSRTKSSSIIKEPNPFPDFCQKFTSCCLQMAITIARFIGGRDENIHWKSEEDVYALVIQSF
jgi:hypothetical protein